MQQCVKSHLSYDVDGAHEQVVQVPVNHNFAAVHQRVLKAGPDLQPLFVTYVQGGAEL